MAKETRMYCPLKGNGRFGEIYYLGYTHGKLQFIIRRDVWKRILEMARSGNRVFSEQGEMFTPPRGLNSWGFHSAISMGESGDWVVAEIRMTPMVPGHINYEDDSARAMSLHMLTMVLGFLIEDYEACEAEDGWPPQLFHLETVADAGPAGSPVWLIASKDMHEYLSGIEPQQFVGVEQVMVKHFDSYSMEGEKNDFWIKRNVHAEVHERGVIYLATVGSDSPCLSTSKEEWEGEGCGYELHGRSVDTQVQQFNLVVGAAALWTQLRQGILSRNAAVHYAPVSLSP